MLGRAKNAGQTFKVAQTFNPYVSASSPDSLILPDWFSSPPSLRARSWSCGDQNGQPGDNQALLALIFRNHSGEDLPDGNFYHPNVFFGPTLLAQLRKALS